MNRLHLGALLVAAALATTCAKRESTPSAAVNAKATFEAEAVPAEEGAAGGGEQKPQEEASKAKTRQRDSSAEAPAASAPMARPKRAAKGGGSIESVRGLEMMQERAERARADDDGNSAGLGRAGLGVGGGGAGGPGGRDAQGIAPASPSQEVRAVVQGQSALGMLRGSTKLFGDVEVDAEEEKKEEAEPESDEDKPASRRAGFDGAHAMADRKAPTKNARQFQEQFESAADKTTAATGKDGGFKQDDAFAAGASAACEGPTPSAPMPRRCHLAPTYHAGRAAWQRRLRLLAGLPPALATARLAPGGGVALDAPDGQALAVDARLDRDAADGPGRVWLRIALRSTDRWGMRRPPFDLAVIVGQHLAGADAAAACRSLQALGAGVEAQDRLTLLPGGDSDPQWDGVSGSEVPARLAALCAHGLAKVGADLPTQHARARALLAAHAAAQHRVAGTRAIVVLAGDADGLRDLLPAASASVDDPTLTSVIQHGAALPGDDAWALADAGHGAFEHALPNHEAAAARALWQGWSRVVARLVRVDLRLGPDVVALRVIGSRVLGAQETREVRRREQAVDANLARVAGVQSDRKDDGLGMTMLIPAFLGSDGHVIDVELAVPGAGAVADVVVDYKDLVRMQNARATARAELSRLPPALSRAVAVAPVDPGALTDALREARALLVAGDLNAISSVATRLRTAATGVSDGASGILAQALQQALAGDAERAAVAAWLDVEIAGAAGCHVRPR